MNKDNVYTIQSVLRMDIIYDFEKWMCGCILCVLLCGDIDS